MLVFKSLFSKYSYLLLVAFLLAVCSLTSARAQVALQQEDKPNTTNVNNESQAMPALRPAPDLVGEPSVLPDQQSDLKETSVKQTLPPEIPAPPLMVLPSPARPGLSKEPLAWRAKALAMSVEYPYNEKNGAVWVLPIAYDKVPLLLKNAINQAGLEIAAAYPDAGQYLIHSLPLSLKPDEIIIVSQPVGESKTLFKFRICSGNNTNSKKIYDVPVRMKELFENRGLWQ